MSDSLDLGFKSEPKYLEVILKQKGFKHDYTLRDKKNVKIRAKIYRLSSGISFIYHDHLDKDNNWPNIIKDYNLEGKVVAQGSLGGIFGKDDYNEALEIGRFLRDHYNAYLHNPQTEEIIID